MGSMSTELISEFTHFNLVIRLRNVQQLAFLFCTFSEMSCRSGCPLRSFVNCILCREKPCRTSETSFLQHFYSDIASCHDRGPRQVHDFQVWSLFFWLFGEVKHVVHLIRWNLKAVLCQLGQDLTTVPVQGIIARHLGN